MRIILIHFSEESSGSVKRMKSLLKWESDQKIRSDEREMKKWKRNKVEK